MVETLQRNVWFRKRTEIVYCVSIMLEAFSGHYDFGIDQFVIDYPYRYDLADHSLFSSMSPQSPDYLLTFVSSILKLLPIPDLAGGTLPVLQT
jgi:hypothetical protein